MQQGIQNVLELLIRWLQLVLIRVMQNDVRKSQPPNLQLNLQHQQKTQCPLESQEFILALQLVFHQGFSPKEFLFEARLRNHRPNCKTPSCPSIYLLNKHRQRFPALGMANLHREEKQALDEKQQILPLLQKELVSNEVGQDGIRYFIFGDSWQQCDKGIGICNTDLQQQKVLVYSTIPFDFRLFLLQKQFHSIVMEKLRIKA